MTTFRSRFVLPLAVLLTLSGVVGPMAASSTPSSPASPAADCETLKTTDSAKYQADCVPQRVAPAAPSDTLASPGDAIPCLHFTWLPIDAPKWSSVIVAGNCDCTCPPPP
jgi:hypothetical protein